MRAIRQFARSVARRFEPERIILFGSYAYGTPNADSDVDILVVMPCRSRIGKAVQIQMEFPVPFAMGSAGSDAPWSEGSCRNSPSNLIGQSTVGHQRVFGLRDRPGAGPRRQSQRPPLGQAT